MIYEQQDKLRKWAQERLSLRFTPDARFLGRMTDAGEILGCGVYDDWTGLACTVHMAGVGPGWATPEFLYLGFHYPFMLCGCEMLLARVVDPKTIALDHRLGFKTMFVLHGAHPDGPLHYMCMKKEDCRWLKRGTHGKQSTSPAAGS